MTVRPVLDCDVLVIGSGAGGLSAAVTAATLGLRVIVAEKESVFGGTTAWSGGWMWIPRNPLAVRAGITEELDAPRAYLKSLLGDHFDAEKVDALLERGPEMVEFFESHTAVRFIDGNHIPDCYAIPGAATGGRSVGAMPFDGRELGQLIKKIRKPLSVISIKGMGLAAGKDIYHFYRATRSVSSAFYVARRLFALIWHLLYYGRSMHLVNGNALVARLIKSAVSSGVDLRTDARAVQLITIGQRVCGAYVEIEGVAHEVRARRAIVLATGGYPHDIERRGRTFAYTPSGHEHWSAAPRTNTGDGIRLGEAVGGHFDAALDAPAAWVPVSLVPHHDGSDQVVFPHLIDRAKPGVIAVTRKGQRFVNEAAPYRDFIIALISAINDKEEVAAWLICDHRFQRRYGLGFSKPFPFPVGSYVRSGYLKRAATLGQLAAQCGIDPEALLSTVEFYNVHAKIGKDLEFQKGETFYNRTQGDAEHGPNPCIAPIEVAPFYAVKVLPGSLGTFAGLSTDAASRVLGEQGEVIDGLYATGNDSASMMGGFYPSGGITLGPGMTFGYLAGLTIAEESGLWPTNGCK